MKENKSNFKQGQNQPNEEEMEKQRRERERQGEGGRKGGDERSRGGRNQ